MEWAAFGLARDPFQRSAELDDACLPNTVSALLSELLSSLRSPQGVSVLVGDGGSGKSMLASSFARRAGGTAHVATISDPTSCVTSIAREARPRQHTPVGVTDDPLTEVGMKRAESIQHAIGMMAVNLRA